MEKAKIVIFDVFKNNVKIESMKRSVYEFANKSLNNNINY